MRPGDGSRASPSRLVVLFCYREPALLVRRSYEYQTYYNLIDAAVVIISIPIALLVLFAQRRIVAGLTAGSSR